MSRLYFCLMPSAHSLPTNFTPFPEFIMAGFNGMINYRVASLKKVLAALKKEGVWVDPKTEKSEFGHFGWIKDGEGNRVELWQPPKGM